MPRRIAAFEKPLDRADKDLTDRLVHELRSGRESGQPVAYEHEFPTGYVRVTDIWDEWDRLPLEDRTEIILRAYDEAVGSDYRGRIALASGLTVPEAHAAGMLPYRIIPALRSGDQVTIEECRQALIEEGASILFGADSPQLRFATLEEAEAARRRLVQRLPSSDQVWVITQDVGRAEDWLER